ncbi:MAG: cytochrome ubiquinol oxidase subunit I [Phormidesmis sp.]
MEFLPDAYVLSRMQFALTALFHMLWPVLTTGMGIYLSGRGRNFMAKDEES